MDDGDDDDGLALGLSLQSLTNSGNHCTKFMIAHIFAILCKYFEYLYFVKL